jgi:hypothetical protein
MRVVDLDSEPEYKGKLWRCAECGGAHRAKDMVEIEFRETQLGFIVCLDCLSLLHSTTSPLSVLVQTGKDTQ